MRLYFTLIQLLVCFSAFSQTPDPVLFWDKVKYKWGYKDMQGKVVIPATFSKAGIFSEGLASVTVCDEDNDNCFDQFITTNGTKAFVLPSGLQIAITNGAFSEGLCVVTDGNMFGYMDKQGKMFTPLKYRYAGRFREGLAGVYTCEEKVVSKYDSSKGQTYDQAQLVNCKTYFMNRKGEIVLLLHDSLQADFHSRSEDNVFEFNEGLTPVNSKATGLTGFINKEGKLAVPCKYNIVGGFSEGLAFAGILKNTFMDSSNKNVIGYINTRGEMIVKLASSLANLQNGCFFNGRRFKNGKSDMVISENDGDCANSGSIVIDNKGNIVKRDF
jgi:hypothetical protein